MQPFARLALLAVAFLVSSGTVGLADPCPEYPLLEESRIGSTPVSSSHPEAARKGDLVFTTGYHSDFQVYDLSHPTHPALVTEVDAYFPHNLADPRFEFSGDLGYVGGCDRVVPVFDLSDPTAPVELNRIPIPFDVTAIAVVGDLLYTASYGRRTFSGPDSTAFHIIDVADPTNPIVLAEIWDNHWAWAYGLAVRDGVAYLGANSGLLTFDVSDPAAVVQLDHLDLGVGWSVSEMSFAGNLLHATAGPTFTVIDVSDPTDLVVMGSVNTQTRSTYHLSVHGNLAVTSHRGAGLRVIDITDPTQPTIQSVWISESSCSAAFLEADRLCVVKPEELMVAARDFPDFVASLGAVELQYLTERAILDGDLLYTAHVWQLFIHDVSDPAAPVLLGSYEDGRAYLTLSLDGPVLYLAGSGTGGVVAVDVSDPTAPVKLSQLTLDQASSVHAVTGRVAVGLRSGGVRLYDTSDPGAPVSLGELEVDPGNRTYGVHLEGDHIYTHSRWTRVIDATDPAAMQVVASNLTGWGYDLVADGPWIYAPGDELTVLRFTPPATLEVVAGQSLPGSAQDLHLAGDQLYVAGRWGSVQIFDVADPAGIRRLGGLPPYRESYGVTADDTRVAIVNRSDYSNPQGLVEFWDAPCVVTGIDDPVLPSASALSLDVAPNPFNPRVTVSFDLPRSAQAELAVFDLRGRHVATVHAGPLESGRQTFRWDGVDSGGRPVASGAYIVRLQAAGEVSSRTVMLAR